MPRSGLVAAFGLPRNIKEEELKPGDHIYTKRKGYYHHGIYMGDDIVIHFTKVSESNPPGDDDKCDHYKDTTTDEPLAVRMCCLKCFVCRKPGSWYPPSLFIFEYGKSLTHTLTHTLMLRISDIGGSRKKALPAEEVLRNAAEMLDNEKVKYEMLGKKRYYELRGRIEERKRNYEMLVSEKCEKKCFGKYSLVCRNCETFAFYCKTERRASKQVEQMLVEQVLVTAVVVVFSILRVVSRCR